MAIASQGDPSRKVTKGIFLNGLKKDNIAEWIEKKLYNARDLAEIMDTTLLIENKNNEIMFGRHKEEGKRNWKNNLTGGQSYNKWRDGGRGSLSQTSTNHSGKNSVDNKKVDELSSSTQKKISHRLSQNELRERSRKGLCFQCGENVIFAENEKLQNGACRTVSRGGRIRGCL
ncbi:unnamed protein product [Cuscuta europaea]|uniref:Uncharacterized protein n=1 Tax=Cuscuta europaea TaxID=41803 RepID=A0A9P1A0X2_CUSEU|nr:unnamed protein product [Cuscuta europaea]